jgi:MFS family permease
MACNTATTQASRGAGTVIRTLIPARLDRLPWSRFHTRLVAALGVAWILDGLEVTFASNMTTNLQSPHALGLTTQTASQIATWYLLGQVAGALVFGRLSDRPLSVIRAAGKSLAGSLTPPGTPASIHPAAGPARR